MPEKTPRPGQVYSTPDGTPMLYVRTGKRYGVKDPEHLFVSVRERVVMEHWHPADEPLPEEMELRLDPKMAEAFRAFGEEYERMERKNAALVATMRRAAAMVPPEDADELRRTYTEGVGE